MLPDTSLAQTGFFNVFTSREYLANIGYYYLESGLVQSFQIVSFHLIRGLKLSPQEKKPHQQTGTWTNSF